MVRHCAGTTEDRQQLNGYLVEIDYSEVHILGNVPATGKLKLSKAGIFRRREVETRATDCFWTSEFLNSLTRSSAQFPASRYGNTATVRRRRLLRAALWRARSRT